ncbi:MAG: folylpolyglutamate synthase/dihydrofolate synthase family protein [Terracidiphilus sp.]|jgi:dihydrofolate synthase/folylpolyglutamate synthase
MSYQAAIEQLNALTAELYTRPGQPRRKLSLDEIRTLLKALGDPQSRVRTVLIGGTNGKGSTASTLSSILTASGVRAGLYTSPHLERVNERIRLGDVEIADEAFAALYFQVHEAAQRLLRDGALPHLPSYFEFLTAMALFCFAQEVELAVLEVGMGGRRDATNIVDPLISVITDISLDHTEWLGSTISAITREKAGILRRGGTLITLSQHPEANQVLGEAAAELNVRTVNAAAYMPASRADLIAPYFVQALGAAIEVNSPLAGAHQQRNIALAIATAVELASAHGLQVSPAAIANGIRQTRWPARLERIEAAGVEWILDVAHNPASVWALRAGLGELKARRPRTLVFSCLRDKPVAEMAQILFPLFEQVILAPIQSPRAAAITDLEAAARATGTPAVGAGSVRDALQWAQARGQGGVVVVSGSVYLVGEARSVLLDRESRGVAE